MNKHRLALFAALSLWASPTFAADSTVTAMPAAAALTGPELFYCIQGGVDSKCTATQVQTFGGGPPGGAANTLQFNNAGAFGGVSGTSWDDTNRSLTITGATVTANNPVLNITQTWNNAGVVFNGLFFNVVSTAADNASLSLNLQRNGGSTFTVTPFGAVTAVGTIVSQANIRVQLNTGQLSIGASNDVIFTRRAAASPTLGAADAAAPVAQTLGVQGVVAGTANTAGALWTQKGSVGTGTGVGGNIKWQVALAGGAGSAQNAYTDALTLDASAAVPRIAAGGPVKLKSYTVAGLPAGSEGDEAYVTDQLTSCPLLGGTFTGGGNVKCKAFYDGTSWNHQ